MFPPSRPTAGPARSLRLGRRIGFGLGLAIGIALGSWGCGRAEPEGRFAVVQRDFVWQPGALAAGAPAAPTPRSLNWSFGTPQPEWSVAEGSGAIADGALQLEGHGKVGLAGPGRRVVDDELVHWLSVRLATSTARTLQLSWHGGAPRSIALQATGEPETVMVSLESLRTVVTGPDAPDLTLVAVGEPGQPVQLRIEQIGLVSDFESVDGDSFTAATLVRAGVRRTGAALLAPGELRLPVHAADGDRLRFALALVGSDEPVEVVLEEADGRMPEQRFRCTPGAAWTEHALLLTGAPEGAAWNLVFRAAAAPGSRAVVLIGSPLLLRRTRSHTAQVVLYVEDTLRADHLQTLGYPRPTDPNLREIAAAGTTFTRTWSTTNWTRPAVSSLLTGLDTAGHANVGIEWRVADELVTLTEALAEAGCVTASFVTNHHGGSWSGLQQGFDAHGDPAAFGSDAVTSTLTSSVIREPIEAFLAEHSDESFFVYAHSLDPHAPYEPDPRSLEELATVDMPARQPIGNPDAARRATGSVVQYDAEIRHNDRELSLLLAALEAHGLTDDTLFVFVSDHGEAFFEHGQWEHRRSLHEEEIRVPWVMRWPRRLPSGIRSDLPCSLADVAPTILGLLELPLPTGWRGRDLSSLCLDPLARLPASPLLVTTLDVPSTPARAGEAALIAWPQKLIVDVAVDGTLTPRALYLLDGDPQERQDRLPQVGADDALVVALLTELHQRLNAGPASDAGTSRAVDISPEIEAWMMQMGYLR